MADNGVEQRPSETAYFAALRRAIANKEFDNQSLGPDHLAQYFLPPLTRFLLRFMSIRVRVKNRLDEFLPGLYEYMIARTAFFDGVFLDALQNEAPQIVLLGAGYDTRAYRFAKLNTGSKVIELDIASTQNIKKKFLNKARIDIPEEVYLMPIDFNKESLGDVLGKAGYRNDQKTLFIWEGVSYYLKPDSVDATLAFVSQSSHPDSVIAFDYVISISDENVNDYYGVKEFLNTMGEQHAEEQLVFAIDEGAAGSFLASMGLNLVDHLDNEQIEKTFLLNEDGAIIGPITGHFRFVTATPRVG
jgi:methyltransferase (TIGR00027 family)